MPQSLPHLKVLEYVATHGIKGALRANAFVENTQFLFSTTLYDAEGSPVNIRLKHKKKQQVIIEIEGINSIEDAQKHIGKSVYIPHSALPTLEEKESFYPHQLIGKTLHEKKGKCVGTVIALHNFGAGDIIEYVCPNGKKEMLAFDQHSVHHIGETRITVTLPHTVSDT